MNNNNGTLLSVKDLKTYFQTEDGVVKAVDGISFELEKGETLGIVGESGSGKSVTNLSVMRLIPEPPGKIVGGDIRFDGIDVRKLSIDEVRKIRGKRMAMIFQDPMTSLNPFLRISTQLMEVTHLHLGHNKTEAYQHAIKMLKTVGIPDAENRVDSYPHEFSGGMRQRVMIAMALSCDPELLIADEPTTALDVTIQAQILELIKDLKTRTGTSVILITHDLGVVAGMTEKIIVMYAGKVFEQAPTKELFATPANPYTKGLLKSVPDPAHEQGAIVSNSRTAARCRASAARLSVQRTLRTRPGSLFSGIPPFVEINANHRSLCHFAKEVYAESVAENASKT
jgi:oligopeptide transport system ATP-binding protein